MATLMRSKGFTMTAGWKHNDPHGVLLWWGVGTSTAATCARSSTLAAEVGARRWPSSPAHGRSKAALVLGMLPEEIVW